MPLVAANLFKPNAFNPAVLEKDIDRPTMTIQQNEIRQGKSPDVLFLRQFKLLYRY